MEEKRKYPREYYDLKSLLTHEWYKYYVSRLSWEIEQLKSSILKIDFSWNWNEKLYSKFDLYKVRYSVLTKMVAEPELLLRSFDIEIMDIEWRLDETDENDVSQLD